MLPLLRCFFAHLLILQYPDHHQNLISSYLYYSGPVHKISSQSVHNFLSNVVHRQTNRQTDKLTNATKNITSFAKEVNIVFACIAHVKFQKASFTSIRDIKQNVAGDGVICSKITKQNCSFGLKVPLWFLENMPGPAKINACNWLMVMENHDF